MQTNIIISSLKLYPESRCHLIYNFLDPSHHLLSYQDDYKASHLFLPANKQPVASTPFRQSPCNDLETLRNLAPYYLLTPTSSHSAPSHSDPATWSSFRSQMHCPKAFAFALPLCPEYSSFRSLFSNVTLTGRFMQSS